MVSEEEPENIHIFNSLKDIRETSTNIQFEESKMETEFKDKFTEIDMPNFDTFEITPNMDENQIKENVENTIKNYKDFDNYIAETVKPDNIS